jgi:hypothetical protein
VSMSMYVLHEVIPNRAEWQAAITAAGFDLILDPSLDTKLNTGFLPARYNDIDTGFEFDVSDLPDSVPEYLESSQADDPRRLSANFRWGGDILEMCCAFAAAAALAKLTNGVLYQGGDGSMSVGDDAIVAAKAELLAADGMY